MFAECFQNMSKTAPKMFIELSPGLSGAKPRFFSEAHQIWERAVDSLLDVFVREAAKKSEDG
jgi:hypothetical protein